ncbi:MAG: acetylglutamate kinase [Candidatus Melainabacteria bacterium RIFCSPHIGHO2_02_FULL_34_12]|nr:MAG: acetylglutamate kinase [Candidatus Melainabacteria bacterium RIFCSPHIGHO2_02_FULL_34_12]
MTKRNISSQRVEIISQALPYIQRFHNKIFVIKYGGAAMTNPELKKETIRDFVLLSCVGIKLILVHGGGPEISEMSKRLNLPVKFVDGYRVTDKATMEIVEMVLVGKVQKDLVNLINVSGARAIGLCGKDGCLFSAKPIPTMKKFGYIGEVDELDTSVLMTVIDKEFIPVISSVGADRKGQNYNINADNVASAIACALKATKLILMTDTPGILKNPKDSGSLISKISVSEAHKLIKKKIISGGMIPKTKAAISSIKSGVGAVHIINGSQKHSVLLEILTDSGIGTMITR